MPGVERILGMLSLDASDATVTDGTAGMKADGKGTRFHLFPRRKKSSNRSMAHMMRIKFVLSGTVAMLIVLSTILGIAEMTVYTELIETADHTLTLLADSDGTFPEDAKTYGLYDDQITRETPYESRWFSVKVAKSSLGFDEGVTIDTSQTVTIDEDTARRYAQIATRDGHSFGFVNTFRYIHRETPDSDLFIFLDRGRQLQSFKKGVAATVSIAMMGIAAVVVILALASGPVVRPFVESNIKQRQFITNAGHDIKTPLTIIAADADVLSMEIGEDNEWLADIHRQVDELTKLTNDLIFLSKMEEDQSDREHMQFDLSIAVSDVARSFLMVAVASGKEIETDDIDDGVIVLGDERMLRQLTSVLIDNALKYSDDGGTVSVSLFQRKKTVMMTVENTTDDAEGLQTSRWFDRFYQEDESRSHGRGGFGIGLSIAQAVVSAHNGQIRASARDDVVEISVTMPIGI